MKTLLIPRRKDCLDAKGSWPFGMTHLNDTPCPFANERLPVGFINTCCSFNMEVVAESLISFGNLSLAKLLLEELAADRLPLVVKELRRVAYGLKDRYVEAADMPDGSRTDGIINLVTEELTPCPRPTFDATVASILQAADWYEKVGDLGFDVVVWY